MRKLAISLFTISSGAYRQYRIYAETDAEEGGGSLDSDTCESEPEDNRIFVRPR